jgi:hypothetical protein
MTFLNEPPIAGVVPHDVLATRLGSIRVGAQLRPACLWSKPAGYIGPTLLRRELACAQRFAEEHPEGWSFVVDTRAVRAINPINPLLLRRMLRSPGLRHYVAITPRWIRVLAWIGSSIFRPTHLVSSEQEALAILAEDD